MTDRRFYMPQNSTILSSRILRLSESLNSGDKYSIEVFWQEIENSRTPIIEKIENNEDHSLVTFIWRGGTDLSNVHVICAYINDSGEMFRLGDTDLWFASYIFPNDISTAYLFMLNDIGEPVTADNFVARVKAGLFPSDPYNPDNLLGGNTSFPQESLLAMPFAAEEPWIGNKSNPPHGKTEKMQLRSEILDQDRILWVYIPPSYSLSSGKYPWLMMLDGGAYVDLGVPIILDNLIAARKIPPCMAFFVESFSHGTRHIESSCNPDFARFLAEEAVPWLDQRYQISSIPEQVMIGGDSYTGLSATFAAFRYPQIFGNVLAQSSPYFWFQGMDREPDPGEDQDSDWLIRKFENSVRLPLRFHLEAGSLETGVDPTNKAQTSILNSNRHMRDVLKAKGYEVDYVEANGGHDFANWRRSLPRAIIFLANRE